METRFLHFLALALFLFSQNVLAQWTAFDPGGDDSHFVISVAGVDENVAWAVPMPFDFSTEKHFIRTSDGGTTWTFAEIDGASDNFNTLQIFAIDEHTAWANRLHITQNSSEILKTTDGGLSWTQQAMPVSQAEYAVVGIHFFDENNGTAFAEVNDGAEWFVEAYWTDDGGDTWQLAQTPYLADERLWIWVGNSYYEAIGNTIWFGTSQGRIFRSIDQGKNWEAFDTGLEDRTIHSLAFKDELHGIAVSIWSTDVEEMPNVAVRTSDGGRTWTQSPVPDWPPLGSIEHIPGSGGVYLLNGASFWEGPFISRDNGNTWKLSSEEQIDCLDFSSSDMGWAGGQIGTKPGMYRWNGGEQLFDPSLVTVRTVAGTGVEGFADGETDEAKFWNPYGMAMDRQGNLYVAEDYGNRIRKITPDGTVSTLAGTGESGYANGPGDQAQFFRPQDVACDSEGNVYVADANNNVIRKITPDGEVSLFAGQPGVNGSADGPALEATFGWCPTLGIDALDNLYVADGNGIRKISPDGQVSTPWASGTFIWGMDVDADGNVYFGDFNTNQVRKLTNENEVETIAGGFGCQDGASGSFSEPAGVAADAYGNVYVADGTSNRVRKIAADGSVSTLAGDGCFGSYASENKIVDGHGEVARFGRLRGILLKPDGNLLVNSWDNDAIREVMLGTQAPPLAVLESVASRKYQVTPLSQWEPMKFEGSVLNTSDAEVAEVRLNVKLHLDGQQVFNKTSPAMAVSGNDVEILEISAEFETAETGTYQVTFTYSTAAGGAFFTGHDEFTVSDSVLAADDGHLYFTHNVDFNNPNAFASYGQEYELVNGDSLIGFSAKIIAEDANFIFAVHAMQGNTVGQQGFATDTLYGISNESPHDFYFPLPQKFFLPPGRFLFTLERFDGDGSLGMGVDSDRNDQSAWYSTTSSGAPVWTSFTNFWGAETAPVVMLRPVFKQEVMTPAVEVGVPFEVQVFPNPASDYVNIFLPEAGSYQLQLFGLDGKLLNETTATGGGTSNISLQGLAAGSYLVKIIAENGTVVQRITKM